MAPPTEGLEQAIASACNIASNASNVVVLQTVLFKTGVERTGKKTILKSSSVIPFLSSHRQPPTH